MRKITMNKLGSLPLLFYLALAILVQKIIVCKPLQMEVNPSNQLTSSSNNNNNRLASLASDKWTPIRGFESPSKSTVAQYQQKQQQQQNGDDLLASANHRQLSQILLEQDSSGANCKQQVSSSSNNNNNNNNQLKERQLVAAASVLSEINSLPQGSIARRSLNFNNNQEDNNDMSQDGENDSDSDESDGNSANSDDSRARKYNLAKNQMNKRYENNADRLNLPDQQVEAASPFRASGSQTRPVRDELGQSELEAKEAADAEAAERSEQEAAEASEADATNKLALDEQQQQQREIILAQAQNEAKAIKAQQEALLNQQRLQQQMLLKRQHRLINNDSSDSKVMRKTIGRRKLSSVGSARGHRHLDRNMLSAAQTNDDVENVDNVEKDHYGSHNINNKRHHYNQDLRQQNYNNNVNDSKSNNHIQQRQQQQRARSSQAIDTQFSDQPDSRSESNSASDAYGDHSVRQPSIRGKMDNEDDEMGRLRRSASSLLALSLDSNKNTSSPLAAAATATATAGTTALPDTDLTAAAQHHYGAHYDSLHSHHKDYYQFAESHKKGQFDSGFKRGGKKFQISGHSSQHKTHAEGHVKWYAKKGKGTHYWDYKHKDKNEHQRQHHYHHFKR